MELEAFSVHTRVKVVHVDVLLRNHTCKQMSTVCELDLIAAFVHNGLERNNRMTEDIAPDNLVL